MISNAYIRISNKEYPIHEGDIRLEHPEIGELFICPVDFAPVYQQFIPIYDQMKQTCFETKPVLTETGWVTTFEIRDLTEQEINYLASLLNPPSSSVPPVAASNPDPNAPVEPTAPSIAIQAI